MLEAFLDFVLACDGGRRSESWSLILDTLRWRIDLTIFHVSLFYRTFITLHIDAFKEVLKFLKLNVFQCLFCFRLFQLFSLDVFTNLDRLIGFFLLFEIVAVLGIWLRLVIGYQGSLFTNSLVLRLLPFRDIIVAVFPALCLIALRSAAPIAMTFAFPYWLPRSIQ